MAEKIQNQEKKSFIFQKLNWHNTDSSKQHLFPRLKPGLQVWIP